MVYVLLVGFRGSGFRGLGVWRLGSWGFKDSARRASQGSYMRCRMWGLGGSACKPLYEFYRCCIRALSEFYSGSKMVLG